MHELVIDAALPEHTISRHCFGQFAEHLGCCIYDGFWVGEDSAIPNTRGIRGDLVQALRELAVPNLRWPGGCFADTYHWEDGVGPRESRPSIVNVHWGGVTESNHFGTHEFFELCEQLDCAPVICGNLGSGTVREMAEWLEYMTMRGHSPRATRRRQNGRDEPFALTYFGVGNENWGCGGNMRAEYYADEYLRYACYCRNYDQKQLFRIACGANAFDEHWTEVLMQRAASHMEGLSLHYYCGFGCENRSATKFGEKDYFELLVSAQRLEELLRKHGQIMDRYDPERRVALVLDEWGAWHEPEPGTNPAFLYQQNTVRDALVAALSLNIIGRHAARVRMANIAQVVNVLQAMVLTLGDRMLLTPTYHVFRMYRPHQDAVHLPSRLTGPVHDDRLPLLDALASRDAQGKIHVSLCNLDPERPHRLRLHLLGAELGPVSGCTLRGQSPNAHNTFEAPTTVQLEPEVAVRGNEIELPPHSVTTLALN